MNTPLVQQQQSITGAYWRLLWMLLLCTSALTSMPTLAVSCVVTQMSASLERHRAVIYRYLGFLGLVVRVALIALLFLLPNTVDGDILQAERDYRFGPIGQGWLPLTGDWDGNGTDTVGFYDPFTGKFFIKNSHAGGAADRVYRFGPIGQGWLPLTGDWDGNGTDTVGLYDPVISRFYLRNRHRGGVADVTYRFGPMGYGWEPVTGDWDGNDIDTGGLYDPGMSQFFLRNLHAGGVADLNYRFVLVSADLKVYRI